MKSLHEPDAKIDNQDETQPYESIQTRAFDVLITVVLPV